MSEYGQVVAERTVRFKRVLPGPIEMVWEYLVDSEKRGVWLARGEMERKSGGKMELFWKHSELSSASEEIPERFKSMEQGLGFTGQVLEYDAPHRLVISWWDTGSTVTFELTPQGDDVLLALTHAQLPDRGQMLSVSGGWHTHLDILVDRLNGREPTGFWKRFTAIGNAYESRIPG